MITSTSNGRIKNLIQLQKKSKLRREQDVFLAEGLKMYQEAPRDRVLQTYVSETFYKRHRELRGEDVQVVADHVFEAVSDTKTPQGILCVVRQHHYSLEQVLAGRNPLLLVLENLQDPGNLGTILRTGEGAGVTGVIMSQDTADLYNPKTIRSTMGSIYRMPFCYVPALEPVMSRLRQLGITSYAAHLRGKASYTAQDYRPGTAFLIGNEGKGLTEELAAQADALVRIPMCGQVESLNAAIASAVLMYEALRQRQEAPER